MFNTVNELLPVSSVILIAQHLKVSFCLAYQDFPHPYIYSSFFDGFGCLQQVLFGVPTLFCQVAFLVSAVSVSVLPGGGGRRGRAEL